LTGPDFRIVEAGSWRFPCVLRGPAEGPRVLFAPPLFEEMNRCRRLLADLGRALGGRGIASVLPDLPGTGDSDAAAADLSEWRAAFQALLAALASEHALFVFAVRGGALLTDGSGARGLYGFAPVASGSALLRDMMRAQAVADQERTGEKRGLDPYEQSWTAGKSVPLIGYRISPALAAQLRAAEAATPARTAGLGSGDLALEGPPVWRQADPQPTAALADALAADIADWISRCSR
jgi:hypothetical protein